MKTVLDVIKESEERYSKNLEQAAEEISKTDIKLLLVAGPSCAGKTTSSDRLSKHLKARGRSTKTISLDDFYVSLDKTPKTPEGEYDFETIYALELDLIWECFQSLCEGRETFIPLFDFKNHARVEKAQCLRLKEGEICIVEGLHALNPLIYKDCVDEKFVYKVFLDSFDGSGEKEKARLYRRLARDYYYRNADAQRTLELWDNVVRSERINIRTFENLADVTINTYLDYEQGVLKRAVMKVLSDLPNSSKYAAAAKELIDSIKSVEPINFELVPEESLLQEFIPPLDKRQELLAFA
ncbi:MAG: hypothetical protein GX891_00760 [Clostridiales bacterium]|nr:hypothetical protein [Clostridiales bacterium]